MGTKDGSKILHRCAGLRLPQLSAVLHELRPPVADENEQERRPRIAIDGNWVCNEVSANSSRLLDIASAFEDQGIGVCIVFDGDCRHHSKRASTKRSADREKVRIKAIEPRATLMQLRDGGIATETEEKLEKKLSRSLKTKESQSLGGSGNRFSPEFADAIVALVTKKCQLEYSGRGGSYSSRYSTGSTCHKGACRCDSW